MSCRLVYRVRRKRPLKDQGEEPMPKRIERSGALLVSFQCTAEEYRNIVAAAEENESATSEWIRKVLRQAASLEKPSPVVRER
jgi:hypothetical protein